MKITETIKTKALSKNDFQRAMEILDNELGKERVRDTNFLKQKFKEFPDYFIGAYLGEELVGVVCGFPREDYLLMSELAIDCRFQNRKFGKRLVEEFEKRGFKKFNKINVGSFDNSIEFYKTLNYKPFLLLQFEKGLYDKEDFSKLKILSIKKYGIELESFNCGLEELNKFRKGYPKANLQYIFTKLK